MAFCKHFKITRENNFLSWNVINRIIYNCGYKVTQWVKPELLLTALPIITGNTARYRFDYIHLQIFYNNKSNVSQIQQNIIFIINT